MGIFNDPKYNAKRYGVPDAPGNPRQWKNAYETVMGQSEAVKILNGPIPAKQRALNLLELPLDSTLSEGMIKKAYRQLVFRVHPDHGGTDDEFKKVHAAYSFLLNEVFSGV